MKQMLVSLIGIKWLTWHFEVDDYYLLFFREAYGVKLVRLERQKSY